MKNILYLYLILFIIQVCQNNIDNFPFNIYVDHTQYTYR